MKEESFTPALITMNGAQYIRADIAQRWFEQAPGVERWYSVAELVEITGHSRSSIYRAMDSGDLKYLLPNGCKTGRRIKRSWWEEYANTLSEQSL